MDLSRTSPRDDLHNKVDAVDLKLRTYGEHQTLEPDIEELRSKRLGTLSNDELVWLSFVLDDDSESNNQKYQNRSGYATLMPEGFIDLTGDWYSSSMDSNQPFVQVYEEGMQQSDPPELQRNRLDNDHTMTIEQEDLIDSKIDLNDPAYSWSNALDAKNFSPDEQTRDIRLSFCRGSGGFAIKKSFSYHADQQLGCNHQGCNRSFPSSSDLSIHKRRDHGQYSFTCSFPGCGRTWRTKHNLETHQELNSHLSPSVASFSPTDSSSTSSYSAGTSISSGQPFISSQPFQPFLPAQIFDKLHLVDRPSEVKRIMTFPHMHGLFQLVEQALASRLTNNPSDPRTWDYSQLESWLTETTREDVPDIEWVAKIRTCFSTPGPRSLWESVRAALGVPVDFSGLDGR